MSAFGRRRWARRIGGLAGAYVVICLFACIGQRNLLYHPRPRAQDAAACGLTDVQEVSLTTADGVRLSGWLGAPIGPERQPPTTVLYFHGNAGNLVNCASWIDVMQRSGRAVLEIDYRGYGRSEGRPTEEGLYADARAALAFLKERPDQQGRRFIYYGRSLGTGVALALALEAPPAGLLLISPYTSIVDCAAERYPFLPVRWLTWDRYDSAARVAGLRCPVVMVHGDQDDIIPYAQGRALFDRAPEPKRFIHFPGAGHNNIPHAALTAALDELERLMDAGMRK